MTKYTETQALADYWREHIESWRAGGDPQASYCKARKMIYHRFVYWRRKFEGGTSRRGQQQAGGEFARVTCDSGGERSQPPPTKELVCLQYRQWRNNPANNPLQQYLAKAPRLNTKNQR